MALSSTLAFGRSPEEELLLYCARCHTTPQQRERIRTLVEAKPNWDVLVPMAHRHGITPLFYWHLQKICADAVPQNTLQHLRDHFHANAQWNLSLTAELIRILNFFEEHGVPAIPYKGVVLANSLYGNLAFREFNDLDILVHREDVLRAKSLLMSIGYRPEINLTRVQESAHMRTECEYNFRLDDARIRIEIHWEFVPRYFSVTFNHGTLWKNLAWTSVGGLPIRTLSPEDLLLVLCVHGGKHLWSSLGWVCDVSELIRVHRTMDWYRVMDQSKRFGIKRMLHLGLCLAIDLLQADIPQEVFDRVRSDSSIQLLVRAVREKLFYEHDLRNETIERWNFQSAHLKMRERLRDRIRYCYRHLVALNMRDWSVISLPPVLFPLYYVIRPIRLTAKLVRRIGRHLLFDLKRIQRPQVE